MCTAITLKTKDFYFGRTLDNDYSYREEVTVTPRNFLFKFRKYDDIYTHFAMIGMAFNPDGYPLYYDAVNEKGLCMAGLNFVGNARFSEETANKINLAQFELIPYVLGVCANVSEAIKCLKNINLINSAYSDGMPSAQLHWIIADAKCAVTVEFVEDGLKIYDNNAGVLTNNPPFDLQMFNLNNYLSLTAKEPVAAFSDKIELKTYSRGMGALGLPGDLSSQSRFVRAAFIKLNSVCENTENESVNQFFHILGAVEQPRGACVLKNGKYEITVYSSCCNADKGIYYFTTYDNHRINAVNMNNLNLNGSEVYRFPINVTESIHYLN